MTSQYTNEEISHMFNEKNNNMVQYVPGRRRLGKCPFAAFLITTCPGRITWWLTRLQTGNFQDDDCTILFKIDTDECYSVQRQQRWRCKNCGNNSVRAHHGAAGVRRAGRVVLAQQRWLEKPRNPQRGVEPSVEGWRRRGAADRRSPASRWRLNRAAAAMEYRPQIFDIAETDRGCKVNYMPSLWFFFFLSPGKHF